MLSERRVVEIHIPGLVVAAIAISSVLFSLHLSVTNAVVGTAPLVYMREGIALLPWLAGTGDRYVGNPAWPEHPLYGVTTLMMSLLVGEFDVAGNLVSSVSWAATVPLFFLVCRRLYGVKAAYLSTALLSTNRWMIRHSYAMLSEALYVLLSVLSLLACVHLVRLLRHGNRGVSRRLMIVSSSTGCLLALLYLTRIEGTAVAVSVLAFLCLWSMVRRRADVGVAAVVVMVTLLVILLFPLFVQRQYLGHWRFIPKMGEVNRAIVQLAIPQSRIPFLMAYLRTGYQYVVAFSRMLGSVGIAMIVLLGIITILPPIRLGQLRKERVLPVLFLSPLPILFFANPYTTRFAVPYLFILIMWVGAGAIQVGQRLGKRHATLAIATVLIAISIFSSRDVRFWPHSHVHLTMKDVGLWMKDNLAARDLEGETILGRRGAVIADFYAGSKLKVSGLWGLEFSRPEQLVQYMEANDIRYLLVDAVYTPESHPDLAFLLSDFQAARKLGLEVMRVEKGRTNTSVLYEFGSVKVNDRR